jgi:hypothetical protein
MVGLPTLVQNPPAANNIGNPTGLDSRLLSIWFVDANPNNKNRLS